MSVRKSRKAVKPIAVGFVKLTDQPWLIIGALYKTLMSKTFPQESSEAFFNLKKSALPRTKKNFTSAFRVLWKALRKKYMVSFGFSKKKLFGTLPPVLNKPMGFITVQFSLFMHPDQAQNTSSGIQGQEATAVVVIYVTAPTSSRKTTKYKQKCNKKHA